MQELVILALPIVASQSCDSIMVFTDRVFLSSLGSEQMNAATGGGISSYLLSTFFMGLIGFSTALIAQYFGAKKYENCPKVTVQAIIISLCAYPFIIASLPLIYRYYGIMHLSPLQMYYQKMFVKILVYGSLISLLRYCFSCYFSGIGKTKIVMISAVVTMVINILFNYTFIFGHFGMPALGMRGAAFGTILSSFCGLCILLFYFFKNSNYETFGIKNAFHFDKLLSKKLIRYGAPAGTEFFFNFIAFSVLVFLFQAYNEETATAASIMFNWDMISFVPLIGIEIGVTSLVGRYVGAKKIHVAERAAYSGVKVGWFYSAIVLVFFVFMPELLVNTFKPHNTEALFELAKPLAIKMLQLAAIYVVAEAILESFVGALRGAGDTIWTMWVSMGIHWTFVPTLYASLYIFKLGTVLSWALLVIEFLIFCIVFYFRFKTGKWKNIKLIDRQPMPEL